MFGQTHRMKLQTGDGVFEFQDCYVVRTRERCDGTKEGLLYIIETQEMRYYQLVNSPETDGS